MVYTNYIIGKWDDPASTTYQCNLFYVHVAPYGFPIPIWFPNPIK